MKHACVVFAALLGISSVLYGQGEENTLEPTRLIINNTAEFLPHFALALNGNTPLFSTRDRSFRGNVVLSLAEIAELEYNNDGQVENIYGFAKPMSSWGLKFKILSAKEDQPAVALRIQSSIEWGLEELWTQDLQRSAISLFNQGLWGSRYEYRVTTVHLILTEQLNNRIIVNGGVGVQEIQSRDLWIFGAPGPVYSPGYHAPDVARNLLLCGFLSGAVRVASFVEVIGEVQSLPVLSPNAGALDLSVTRSYVGVLGIRYSITQFFALDGGVVYNTDYFDRSYVAMRIGLNTLLDFQ